MRAKPESTIISWKSRVRNLIVLVELDIKLENIEQKISNETSRKKTLQENDC